MLLLLIVSKSEYLSIFRVIEVILVFINGIELMPAECSIITMRLLLCISIEIGKLVLLGKLVLIILRFEAILIGKTIWSVGVILALIRGYEF